MSCNPVNDQDNRNQDQSTNPLAPFALDSNLAAVDGDATSLFQYIVKDKVWGTNLDPPESASNVIKPWHERVSTAQYTQSNVDDQLTITVPFNCPVRVKSILFNMGTGDFAPTRCRAFVNRPDGIDFDEADAATSSNHPVDHSAIHIASTLGPAASGKAQADFALLQGQQGVVEYPVSVARFSHTNSITLVLSHSNSTTLSRLFYVGFRGTALVLSKDPSERLNVAAANAADKPIDPIREKKSASQGLAGGSNRSHPSPKFIVRDPEVSKRIAGMATPSTSKSPRKKNALSSSSTTTSLTAASQPQVSASPAAASSNRRRSLSQPPPTNVLLWHLQNTVVAATRAEANGNHLAASSTPGRPLPSAKTPLRSHALTPARRAFHTPSQLASSRQAVDRSLATNLIQTPATEMRKKRNEALLASAQRTREKRRRSVWGVAGWAGGREESPMDLLRRLARAPGFVPPSTPHSVRLAQRATQPSSASVPVSNDPSRTARQSAASLSTPAGTALVPGESVPGDLTRGSRNESSTDTDGYESSSVSHPSVRPDEQSHFSEIGVGRRKSGVSVVRGGIFAALAERGRTVGRNSAISRVSFGTAGNVSSASSRFADSSVHREADLERSLALGTPNADSFVSLDDSNHAAATALEKLDEMTRQSLFSQDGFLALDHDEPGLSIRRASIGRSLSEPPFGDDHQEPSYSDDLLPALDPQASDSQDQDSRLSSGRQEAGMAETSASADVSNVSKSKAASEQTAELDNPSISQGSRSLSQRPVDQTSYSSVPIDMSDGEDGQEVDPDSVSRHDAMGGPMEIDSDDDSDGLEEQQERDLTMAKVDLLNPKDLNALLKRRIVKKRKARTSKSTGQPVPPLPTSVIRDMFTSFLTPSSTLSGGSLLSSSASSGLKRTKTKLDPPTLEEVDDGCHDFFAQFSQQLEAASRARTKNPGATTITETDVVAVLSQHGHVSQRNDVSTLAHRMLPREITDQMELSRFIKTSATQLSLTGMLASSSVTTSLSNKGKKRKASESTMKKASR